MSATILAPKFLTPNDLDRYLAQGWRPLGQRIYTADFIQLEIGDIFSVVPTRLPLQAHTWRKGQRKRLRKNHEAFRYDIVPAYIDAEVQALNRQYLLAHPTKSTEELDVHLLHEGRRIFATQMVRVFDDDKLVAFSYFDLGENSAYSKAGIYDPAYQRASLGLFTMYLEIDYCQKNGLKYYYPGYISPNTPLFDYKTGIGEIEFWHLQKQQWKSFAKFTVSEDDPRTVLFSKLTQLARSLAMDSIQTKWFAYPFFEMGLTQAERITQRGIPPFAEKSFVEAPYFLLLHVPYLQTCWIATYSLHTQTYQVWHCELDQMMTFFEQPQCSHELFNFVLLQTHLLISARTVLECRGNITAQFQGRKQSLILKI